jgi:predicted ester cyclase
MNDFLDRMLGLWREPLADDSAAEAAFGRVYADPVLVNGATMPLSGLVARARALQAAYDGLELELLDRVEVPDRLVIAFRMRGRQTGPLLTPLGIVAPTGREVETRVIDILALTGGLVSSVWMVGDELGLLMQLDAVRLADGAR